MLARAMLAGSAAGVTEHTVMFPVDTVKTRMQVYPTKSAAHNRGVFSSINNIVQKEGLRRLYRGASLVAVGAIPAHALYFGAYEAARKLLGATRSEHQPFRTAMAGVAATMGHDLLSTPIDVIKQRLQMANSPLKGITHGFRTIPFEQLFRSYPSTVLLNVPMVVSNFVTYETLRLFVSRSGWGDDRPEIQLLCGGLAGGAAGMVSTPLDVVRTRIQTDCECGKRPVRCVLRGIIKNEGPKALFSGGVARTLYYVPSAAITWAVYEATKRALGWQEELPEDLMDLL